MNGEEASMADEGNSEVATATSAPGQTAPTVAITPELVRAVTEKVYAHWLLELKLERERWRSTGGR